MKKLLLLIIPIILFLQLYINRFEFWYVVYDPDYNYLLNGLNLSLLRGNIGHYDNPGTTVQVLSAIIIRIAKIFSNTNNNLLTDVLTNPEYYLGFIAWTFSIINIILLIISGYIIFKFTNEIIYGILFVSIPFLSPTILRGAFYRVSPEPLLFTSAIIFVMICLVIFKYEKIKGYISINYSYNREINLIRSEFSMLLISLVIGFSLATKITAVPLIILPLILIPKYSNKFLLIIYTFLFFILFTLPIANHYKFFLKWMLSIFFHSGKYGHGAEEIFNFYDFINNFYSIIKIEPFFILTVLVSIVISITWIIKNKNGINQKILIGTILVQVFSFVMVSKHFALHYLIPVIATIFINLFIIISSLNYSQNVKLSIILILCGINVFFNFRFNNTNKIPASMYSVSQSDIQNIYSFGCESKIYSLYFGNFNASSQYNEHLEKIYGKQFFYNIWDKKTTDWNDKIIKIDSLKQINKKILIHGLDRYFNDYPPPFSIVKISERKFQIE